MSTATDMLAKYLAAELAVLDGKHIEFNGRRMTSEDLAEIRAGRREWEARVAAETASASGAPRLGGRSYSVARFND